MALKGLDIFKLSPKKNCKECGSPTCMAFCMKVAQGAVSLDKCPYFSEEALATLNSATAPLMKSISVGEHKLGGETVLFRHEKTLVNKNLYAVSVCTCMDEAISVRSCIPCPKAAWSISWRAASCAGWSMPAAATGIFAISP